MRREIDIEEKMAPSPGDADRIPELRESETLMEYIGRITLAIYETERTRLGSHSAAARRLGMKRTTLYDWVSLRQNGVGTGFVMADAILPKGHRQSKYLDYLIEQDHRFIKRRVNAGLGFFSFNTAGRPIKGYEAMHMVRKEQIEGVGKGAIQGQVRFASNLFMIAA